MEHDLLLLSVLDFFTVSTLKCFACVSPENPAVSQSSDVGQHRTETTVGLKKQTNKKCRFEKHLPNLEHLSLDSGIFVPLRTTCNFSHI